MGKSLGLQKKGQSSGWCALKKNQEAKKVFLLLLHSFTSGHRNCRLYSHMYIRTPLSPLHRLPLNFQRHLFRLRPNIVLNGLSSVLVLQYYFFKVLLQNCCINTEIYVYILCTVYEYQ